MMFLSQVVEEQRPPSMRLKLKVLSKNEIGSGEHVRRSLKELFEYSDEVDYTSFLTEETLSQLSPPSTAASPSDDSTALLVIQILDPPDQSIAYDAEHLGDEKKIHDLWEDFFS